MTTTTDLPTTTEPHLEHPAPYSSAVIAAMNDILPWVTHIDDEQGRPLEVLDPFAGTGRIHQLYPRITYAVELEPEWAALHPRTVVGDATALVFPDATFDAVATSPCYGNRFADHHNAQDGSRRRSYTHDLGRPLSAGSAGKLHWGDAYKELHERAWQEAHRVLRDDGLFLLNIKNHIRKGVEQRVFEWHVACLGRVGFALEAVTDLDTPHMRYGANREARCVEKLVTLRKVN